MSNDGFFIRQAPASSGAANVSATQVTQNFSFVGPSSGQAISGGSKAGGMLSAQANPSSLQGKGQSEQQVFAKLQSERELLTKEYNGIEATFLLLANKPCSYGEGVVMDKAQRRLCELEVQLKNLDNQLATLI